MSKSRISENEMTPSERLKTARVKAGYTTASDAAASMGISRATYIGHENGSRAFRIEAAEKYARWYRVRPAWLLTGEEPMTVGGKPDLERVPLSAVENDAPQPEFDDEDNAYVAGSKYYGRTPGARPEIDAKAGAGLGVVGAEAVMQLEAGETVVGHKVVAEWTLPQAFFRYELHASPDDTIFMPIVGDSMYPTFQSGDRVIIDTQQNAFGSDGIYVFHDGDGTPRVKRLAKILFSEPPQVQIISDNATHPMQTASLEDVMIFGRVVGRISRV
ncbi:LexA family transcriptional regulator [Devosia sp.]|uniref:LexA family transcriptional regulator n=1 Tax=Devosia sp. TaxID=1871048 RepID=UPI001AD30480|nr:LexA family transcriptional regulator [Devosia sp.]MBN9333276.1 LexA family transcriptional regulator [Devosia sp.]